MTLETEIEKTIVRTVLRVMLPLGSDAASSEAQEKANQIISEQRSNVARRMLGVMLAQMGYTPAPGKDDTIQDLSSDARLDLVINTAVCLVCGYRQWRGQQEPTYLNDWPCLEFYRAFPRQGPRDWPARWEASGGRFFSGKSDYPKGRMIASRDDPIWTTISAFGLPFPPFDFNSGMMTEPVSREESVALGVIQIDHAIQPTALMASDEFQERFAAKLHENLAKLEADEERRLSDPLTYGTGDELLDLAEEKLKELENPTAEQIQEIKSFVEKAVEREIDEDDDRVTAIYDAMADPAKIKLRRLAETKRRVASLVKRGKAYSQIGMAERLLANAKHITPELTDLLLALVNRAFETGAGEKYNLRARGYKILVEAYEQTGDAEKADACRKLYLESSGIGSPSKGAEPRDTNK